jgi:DNA-binding HxlR family transcriptional regulator
LAKTTKAAQGAVAMPDETSIKCPYGRLLEVLGKPHTLGILYSLANRSPLRFTQLEKHLDLQPKTLAARLQELVKFGLLARKAYNEIPPRVDYQLTQKGKDLGKLFDELQAWSSKYGDIERPRRRTKGLESPSR